MTSFLSQLNGENILLGQMTVLTMPVGFIGPDKNILIHMTNIGKQCPELTVNILEYFFQSTKIAKKHVRAVTNKSNNKKLLAKGDIVRQIRPMLVRSLVIFIFYMIFSMRYVVIINY